ncbi:signal recognition particle-docking protein FtsY [Bombilactobacillus thymidiniphilus]|uniref:Signal recognition particle receptor FtsY n=1 Tax=Bombilactobacillus thymidiniphilus TaxID=2923363 RepID=A0ABY4PDY0_9LACO|nr:signal recognition particle-docking protein FtsY [Bombilactobacillus thymidiniphilus]UQS83472.1 signal recognition particle-docking protein FtsY [Bombilactobacillus thymidiniphilus]
MGLFNFLKKKDHKQTEEKKPETPVSEPIAETKSETPTVSEDSTVEVAETPVISEDTANSEGNTPDQKAEINSEIVVSDKPAQSVDATQESELKTDAVEYEQGLKKTRHSFRDKFNSFMANFRSVDEDFFDDLEDLLIQADVGYNMAMRISDALRTEVKLQNAKSKADVSKVIIDKMVELYHEDNQNEDYELNIDNERSLNVILFVGVNGAGKTTTIGKLAARLKNENHKVLLAAADTFRAGAIEQLQAWGERIDVQTIAKPAGSDPAAVVYDALQVAKNDDFDVLLVDTAGRLQNNTNLMKELEKIKRIITREIPTAPHEVLLVVDATTGQNALSQAKQFQEVTQVTGIVLSKLDGSSQGGIVLAVNNELHIPVKLVGLGEQIQDLRTFDPEKYTTGLFSTLLAAGGSDE